MFAPDQDRQRRVGADGRRDRDALRRLGEPFPNGRDFLRRHAVDLVQQDQVRLRELAQHDVADIFIDGLPRIRSASTTTSTPSSGKSYI